MTKIPRGLAAPGPPFAPLVCLTQNVRSPYGAHIWSVGISQDHCSPQKKISISSKCALYGSQTSTAGTSIETRDSFFKARTQSLATLTSKGQTETNSTPCSTWIAASIWHRRSTQRGWQFAETATFCSPCSIFAWLRLETSLAKSERMSFGEILTCLSRTCDETSTLTAACP